MLTHELINIRVFDKKYPPNPPFFFFFSSSGQQEAICHPAVRPTEKVWLSDVLTDEHLIIVSGL